MESLKEPSVPHSASFSDITNAKDFKDSEIRPTRSRPEEYQRPSQLQRDMAIKQNPGPGRQMAQSQMPYMALFHQYNMKAKEDVRKERLQTTTSPKRQPQPTSQTAELKDQNPEEQHKIQPASHLGARKKDRSHVSRQAKPDNHYIEIRSDRPQKEASSYFTNDTSETCISESNSNTSDKEQQEMNHEMPLTRSEDRHNSLSILMPETADG